MLLYFLLFMSIEKYSTQGFIIRQYDNGEDNTILKIWTKEFGLVFVKAQSFRKSIKLRQHAMTGRLSHLTLVKGREYYRLAGAKEIIYSNIHMAIICEVIEKFIHGEENILSLFDRYLKYLEYIKLSTNTSVNVNHFKIAIMIESLYYLGYIDLQKINYKNLINADPEDIFLFIELNKKDIVNEIQKSINNTML